MSPAPLKILLVEDDELFRLGLRVRLQQEPGLEVVAEAGDGEMAVELANQYSLDAVLLDVGLPGIGGIEACRQIKQQQPSLPVLVLTSHSQKSLISRLVEAGAQGYCLKGIAAETLILALRSIATGASWWDMNATQEIRASFAAHPLESAPSEGGTITPSLTHRELEILGLLVEGKTNQEIAEALYIASGTVRVHVHAILSKLEVRDRTQAVLVAIKQKLLP
jgi:two-component system, NarL family, response regulator